MIGAHIPAGIIQNFVKFLRFYGFSIQIVHVIDDHRGGDDVQSVAVDDLFGQIGSGIGNNFKHKVPPCFAV